MASKEYLSDTVWYGDMKGTVAFDMGHLPLSVMEIEMEGQVLLAKNEFHCSIVAARKYAEQNTNDSDSAKRLEAEIIAVIRKQIKVQPLVFGGLIGDYYLCQDNEEMTIIGLVKIKGVAELLQEITATTGVAIDPPKLHVTLYKNEKSPYGIGIRNDEDFVKMCRELPEKTLSILRA